MANDQNAQQPPNAQAAADLEARRRKYVREQLDIADAALERARKAAADTPPGPTLVGLVGMLTTTSIVHARSHIRAALAALDMAGKPAAAAAPTPTPGARTR